jgi:hypothetical protein
MLRQLARLSRSALKGSQGASDIEASRRNRADQNRAKASKEVKCRG